MPGTVPFPVLSWIQYRVSVRHWLYSTVRISLTVRNRGFVSSLRGNALAQRIVAADIALGLDASSTFYTPDNCKYLYCPNCSLYYTDIQSTRRIPQWNADAKDI